MTSDAKIGGIFFLFLCIITAAIGYSYHFPWTLIGGVIGGTLIGMGIAVLRYKPQKVNVK